MAAGSVYVAVSGGGDSTEAVCRQAEELGRELARRGAVVVTGGLGGAMAAACRGAKAEGGTTVGILPSGDRADANPWVDVAVATGLGEARNALVVGRSMPWSPSRASSAPCRRSPSPCGPARPW